MEGGGGTGLELRPITRMNACDSPQASPHVPRSVPRFVRRYQPIVAESRLLGTFGPASRESSRPTGSDLVGVPGWSIEIKRCRTALPGEVAAWWRQAIEQAEGAGALPLLLYRADRAEWRAVWPLAVLMGRQRADCWRGIAWTATTTVEAWAAVAREREATERQRRLALVSRAAALEQQEESQPC